MPDTVVFDWESLDPDQIDRMFCGGLTPFSVELLRRVLDERPCVYAFVGPEDDLRDAARIGDGRGVDTNHNWDATFDYLAGRLDSRPDEDMVWEWPLADPTKRWFMSYEGRKLTGGRGVWIPTADRTRPGVEKAHGRVLAHWTIGALTRASVPDAGTVTDEQAHAWAHRATVSIFGIWDNTGLAVAEFET